MTVKRNVPISKLEVAKRGLASIISRYLGAETLRPAAYMVAQPDFDKSVRHYLSEKDGAFTAEERVWFVAAKRTDNSIPRLAKAVEDKMFLVQEEAQKFAEGKSKELGVDHSTFEFKAVIKIQ